MRADKKAIRDAEKAAAWFAKMGIASEVLEEAKTVEHVSQHALQMQGEAVLYSLLHPIRMQERKCKREICDNRFLTNYRYQSYCSMNCVRKELAKMGLQFDPNKNPFERWGGEPPLTVPDEAIKAMRSLLEQETLSPEVVASPVPALSTEQVPQSDLAPTNHLSLLDELEPVPEFDL